MKRAEMDHRAGDGRLEIGRMGILQPGGGTSDDDEGAGKPLEPDLVQNVGCGNGDEPVDGPVMERKPPLAVERHRHLSGTKAVDACARVDGLFQDMAAGPLCDPQHLGRKRGKKLPLEARHHGNAAHGGVAFEGKADETRAGRPRHLFDRREKAGSPHQGQAALADHRNRRRNIGVVRAVAGNQRHGDHRRGVGKHFAEKRVAVGKPVAKRAGREVAKRLDRGGVETVRLRHQDIDTDDERLGEPDILQQHRHVLARPWPLSVHRKAGLVDVDEDHAPGKLRVALKRADPGIGVEADIARAAVDAAEIGQRREQHHRRQQNGKTVQGQPASQSVGDPADHLMASPAEKIGR